MEKLKETWRDLLWYEKLLRIIGFLAAIAAIVLPLTYLLGVCDNTAPVYLPLLAVLMFIQAFDNRKTRRKLMLISLFSGIVVAVCWLVVLIFA